MNPAFNLKSHALNIFIITVYSESLSHISLHLQSQIAQAPDLLKDVGLIVDLSAITPPKDASWLTQLKQLFAQANLPILALLNPQEALKKLSETCDIPSIALRQSPKGKNVTVHNVVHQGPVRSGQHIVSEKGDLIVIGHVSAGAELLAYGNIHVYGTLRGKALAGTQGRQHCHIFCQQLEAELVAIGECYHLTAAMPSQMLQQGPVHIHRTETGLHYESLHRPALATF